MLDSFGIDFPLPQVHGMPSSQVIENADHLSRDRSWHALLSSASFALSCGGRKCRTRRRRSSGKPSRRLIMYRSGDSEGDDLDNPAIRVTRRVSRVQCTQDRICFAPAVGLCKW